MDLIPDNLQEWWWVAGIVAAALGFLKWPLDTLRQIKASLETTEHDNRTLRGQVVALSAQVLSLTAEVVELRPLRGEVARVTAELAQLRTAIHDGAVVLRGLSRDRPDLAGVLGEVLARLQPPTVRGAEGDD